MFPKYLDSDTWSVIYPFNSVFSLPESLPRVSFVFFFVSEIFILYFLLFLFKEFDAFWSSSFDLAIATWSSTYSIYLYLFCDSWILHLILVVQPCGTLIMCRLKAASLCCWFVVNGFDNFSVCEFNAYFSFFA
jgi:hypothetical protein